MRNKGKVEKELAFLSHDEQEFAAHFGVRALRNRALFGLAQEVHQDIKLNRKADLACKLVALFCEAVEKEDFAKVFTFVELLADWTSDAEEVVPDIPAFGYALPAGRDPVSVVLMESAYKAVRLSNRPFHFKWERRQRLEQTARQVMDRLRLRAPGFVCDIKTLRNRAKELGLTFAPDKRGLRKGQRRRHVHRAHR